MLSSISFNWIKTFSSVQLLFVQLCSSKSGESPGEKSGRKVLDSLHLNTYLISILKYKFHWESVYYMYAQLLIFRHRWYTYWKHFTHNYILICMYAMVDMRLHACVCLFVCACSRAACIYVCGCVFICLCVGACVYMSYTSFIQRQYKSPCRPVPGWTSDTSVYTHTHARAHTHTHTHTHEYWPMHKDKSTMTL